MLNRRVVVAIAALGSLAIPSVSAISPVAQAQEIAPVVADDASKQVILDQPRVGDVKITGKVLLEDGQNTQSVTVYFPQRQHSEKVQVTREGTAGTDLVAFEYTVPTLRPLQEGETVTVAIAGKTNTFQTVTVQKALTPETNPAPVPEPGNEHKPEVEQPAPQPQDKEQQPEGGNKPGEGQQSRMPEDGKKPEGEQQIPNPETEKKPEAPKTPEKKPESPKLPGEGDKKPEIDKAALQGSSNIGDFSKTLAAIGGVVGVVSGVVKLFTQGFSDAHFLQPLRGFLAQFNIKI